MSDARHLAEEIAALRREVAALSTASQLGTSSVEYGSTEIYDDNDVLRQVVGEQSDGSFTTIDVNGDPPPVADWPIITLQPGLLVVAHLGLPMDYDLGVEWPLDFAKIEVHVALTAEMNFEMSPASKIHEFTTDGGSVAIALDPGEYCVAIQSVNTSGIAGPPIYAPNRIVTAPATGGVATYHSDTEPIGLDASNDGDIWYDTDEGNLQHRWDGATLTWVPIPIGNQTITGALFRTAETGERMELGIDPVSLDAKIHFFTGFEDDATPLFTDPGMFYAVTEDSLDNGNWTQHLYLHPAAPDTYTPGTDQRMAMLQLINGKDSGLPTGFDSVASLTAETVFITGQSRNIEMFGGVLFASADDFFGVGRAITGLDYGNFADATNSAGQIRVFHNLTRTPNAVVITNDQNNARSFSVIARTSTYFDLRCHAFDGSLLGAGANVSGNWIAIT